MVGRCENNATAGPYQQLDIGDAVMKAGRPILVVPPHGTSLAINRILIAWKDTTEARRAISAALPLLKQATELTIVEIVSDESKRDAAGIRVADVARWLHGHNVSASARVELSAGDAGSQLDAIASEARSDIIVAGAYGHSRLREWIFGGVTHHLLAAQLSICASGPLIRPAPCQNQLNFRILWARPIDLNQSVDATLR